MFFYSTTNDWEEVVYLPTTAGMVALVLIFVGLLAVSAVFVRKQFNSSTRAFTVKQLAFCAMAICLGTVLSNIKVFRFPTGGSITLFSMLAMTLPGYFFGPYAGILSGVAYGVLQLMVDPYVLFPAQLIVDYLLAFGALGLSGLMHGKKNALLKGYIIAILGRYVFAVLSGWLFFGTYAWEGWGALPYSLVYNAIYIFSEGIITIIVISLPAVKSAMERSKQLALAH